MHENDKLTSFEECIKYGLALLKEGDFVNARNAFDKAIFDYSKQDNSKLAKGYSCRGLCFSSQGRHCDAVGDFIAALNADPSSNEARQGFEIVRKYGDITSRIMVENYLGY